MKVIILVATPDGVVEYSVECDFAQIASRDAWDTFVRPLTIRTPPPNKAFELRFTDVDYVQGHGTARHQPDTPIYDQMVREQKAELYKKAYGG